MPQRSLGFETRKLAHAIKLFVDASVSKEINENLSGVEGMVLGYLFHHGLTDTEDRYRRRYLDLIVNDDSRAIALMRPRIVRGIQKYCDDQGFVEVETSIFSPILGGAAAKPFITHFNALDKDFYLRIATELNLKKCMTPDTLKVSYNSENGSVSFAFYGSGVHLGYSFVMSYFQKVNVMNFPEVSSIWNWMINN